MAVYKLEICPQCRYKHNEPKPQKVNKSCPKCGTKMQYLENWYISYQVLGKKFVKAVTPNKRMAEDYLAKIKVDIREGRFFDKVPEISWNKAVEQFRQWFNLNVKPHTQKMYENSLKRLNFHFEQYTLDKITVPMAEQFKVLRKAQDVANATVNRDVATIKRLFSLAEEWGLIEVNKIRKVKLLKENNERIRFLTEGEKDNLLAECKSAHLRLAVLIALNTGLRKEGVLTLKWTEIDFKGDMIHKVVKGDKIVHIPLTQTLKGEILDYKARQKVLSEYIMPSKTKKHLPYGINTDIGFNGAVERAGIIDFTFHDLRHTFASWFLMRTRDQKALQEILGHSDIKTTMRYVHLLKDHLKQAMEKFERREIVL